jgi:glycosyltransferase involved in cell wall biosynthesis
MRPAPEQAPEPLRADTASSISEFLVVGRSDGGADDRSVVMSAWLHQVLVSPLVGGAGIVAIRLAAVAAVRQVPSLAWVPGPGPASQLLEREHAMWRAYDLEAMRKSSPAHLFACARMLPGLVGAARPVVHVHNPTVYRMLRPALAAARARTVVHFQIEPTAEEIRWSMRRPPDRIVTCARYIATTIASELRNVIHPDAIIAVPNSIDVERFSSGSRADARQRCGLQTERSAMLMMANLAPHKGQETAVRALQLLLSRGLPVECWLAGEDRSADAAYERRLRELVRSLGIEEHVRFLGFRPDGPDLLRAADVLLLPSTHEGLPLTILEAQAVGTPVVASTIPGVLEVVEHGRTGFAIAADDFGAYADAVAALCSDAVLRARVSAAAMEQVRREYSWATFEQRMFDIYGSLSPAIGRRFGDIEA